jgi:ABC-2 type transport system permease protein
MHAENGRTERRAAWAVALASARRTGRPGLLWGLLFGLTAAATELSYRSTFPTAASRARLAASMQGNAGFQALFGTIHRIDTVAGYTAYKTGMFLGILGAIWGLLAATRLLRGEEDAGRWELLLAGRTTRGRAALQAAFGLGVGMLALWLPTAALVTAAGASSRVGIGAGASLAFATSLVATAAVFMAVGTLASQLAASRHDANLIGASVLAAAYLVRMAADSDSGLSWLRWTSPLGWVEELRPLTGFRPFPLVPLFVLVALLVAVSVALAARRDLGASALPSRDAPPARTLLLFGQAGLTIRLTRAAVLAWLTVSLGLGVVFGLVAQAAGSALHGSPGLERALARLGAGSAGAAAYLGFVFLVAAILVAVAVAGQVAAMRNEEASGHLDNLLVRPVARWRWLVVRLALGIGLVLAASALVGVAAWLGARSQHAAIGFVDLLEAGLNVAPPALLVLGVGGLAFGLWPRGAIGVTYGLVVWSFLAEILASLSDSAGWLRNTSPLLQIEPAPAASPDWGTAAWLVGIGLATALVGVASFARRDLAGA